MIKLDKIKFTTPLYNVELLESEKWQTVMQNGEVISMKFKQERPCLIIIEVHFNVNEVTMEFTGKILKDDYPLLINKYTIRKCLNAINELGICKMKVESILYDSKVLKCDVTYDVHGIALGVVKNYISTHLVNHRKWNVRWFPKNNNFVIEKAVSTQRLKRKMTIYDKGVEMSRRTNADFLNWVENPNKILDYYADCVRFELSLVSCEAIRKILGIEECDIISVLNATENPIYDFFNNVTCEDSTTLPAINSMRMYDKLNTLIVNDWNLKAIEEKIRQLYPKSYHSDYLDDYRKLLEAHLQAQYESSSTFDISHLFEDDDYNRDMTIKDVGANYWKSTISDVCSWTNNYANIDTGFIVDVL